MPDQSYARTGRRWTDTVDPTQGTVVYDDTAPMLGDVWINTSTRAVWLCIDDAGTWIQTSPGVARLTVDDSILTGSADLLNFTPGITLAGGRTYRVEWLIYFTQTATGTDLSLQIGWPIGGGDAQNNAIAVGPTTSATAIDGCTWTANNTMTVASPGVPNITKVHLLTVRGLFGSGNGGSLTISAQASASGCVVLKDSAARWIDIGPIA